MEFDEEIRQFLIESNENLNALDRQVVELEKNPSDAELIASVFRTIHTIKGTSGFFGFNILGTTTHLAESLLGQVRDKERPLTPALVSLILETVDAVKQVLVTIEATQSEGEDCYQPLRERMNVALTACMEDSVGSSARDEPAAITSSTVALTRVAGEVVPVSEVGRDSMSAARGVPEGILSRAQTSSSEKVADEREEAELQKLERLAPSDLAPSNRAPHAEDLPSGAELPSAPQQRSGYDRRARGSRREDDAAHSTIHVDIALMDKLANLVRELAMVRNQILLDATHSVASFAGAQRLNRITHALQEGVMRARMQPISTVWNMLPRLVRDLATQMEKKIEIQMDGATTELDKTILEAIKDPLTHLVRNACDHGIECPEVRVARGKSPQGTIYLRAFDEGVQVTIEVSDDGAGIDPEKIKSKAVEKRLIRAEEAAQMSDAEALRLILLPGLSTTETVTSISGRGVGMDVVRTNVEKIGGSVEVSNHAGGGLTLTIKIPLALAILPELMGSERSSFAAAVEETRERGFGIPQATILELVHLENEKARMQIRRGLGMEV